ncbi:MAG: type II toxin-antitoxin system PemK/MazF family toxin [Candidatus Entotheonellia bacterium]
MWFVNFDPTVETEIQKTRPAVVVSSECLRRLTFLCNSGTYAIICESSSIPMCWLRHSALTWELHMPSCHSCLRSVFR